MSNIEHSTEKDAILAAVAAVVDEATGYSVPYKRSRYMPIDSAFTNALKAALGVPHGQACATHFPPGDGDQKPGLALGHWCQNCDMFETDIETQEGSACCLSCGCLLEAHVDVEVVPV